MGFSTLRAEYIPTITPTHHVLHTPNAQMIAAHTATITPTLINGVWIGQGSVMKATLAEDEDNVQEAFIMYDDAPQILDVGKHVFKMWFMSGGWSGAFNIYYAESADGFHWTRKEIPVLSHHMRLSVLKNGTIYYMYTANHNNSQIDCFSSPDGIVWTLVKEAVIGRGVGGSWDDNNIANSSVWIENGTWFMLYEAMGGPTIWQVGLATSRDGVKWKKSNKNPVIRNQLNAGGAVGGPCVQKVGSTYYAWLHCAPSYLPTDLCRYKSTDLTTWIIDPDGETLVRFMVDEGVNDVHGQAADPCILEVNGKTYLYYSATRQGSLRKGHFRIKLAIADMTIAELIKTDEGWNARKIRIDMGSFVGFFRSLWMMMTIP